MGAVVIKYAKKKHSRNRKNKITCRRDMAPLYDRHWIVGATDGGQPQERKQTAAARPSYFIMYNYFTLCTLSLTTYINNMFITSLSLNLPYVHLCGDHLILHQ